MPQIEFQRWIEFYKQYPFDDLHRYHRPAALIASRWGGEVQGMLDWLQPDATMLDMDDADKRTLKAFGFTKKGA